MNRTFFSLVAGTMLLMALLPGCTVLDTPNKPPIAVFTAEPQSINVGETIHFSANESKDKDGKIKKYSWTFGDGEFALGPYTSHCYKRGGTFSVDLVVKDDDGAVDRANTTVHVNEWPVAEGLAAKDPVKINEEVTFDGSSSIDKDGKIVEYTWNFGDDSPEVDGAKPTHKFNTIGTFNITLTVKDDHGATAEDAFTIEVVKRHFKVTWAESSEMIDSISDYTEENSTTNKTIEITMTNLTALEFNMTWADHIPVVGAANDEFIFEVEAPDGDIKKVKTTTEVISNVFKIDDLPDVIKHDAASAAEVEAFIGSSYTSKKGNGEYKLRITCVDAGDWYLDQFDVDTGNDWDIVITGYYYSAEIIETG